MTIPIIPGPFSFLEQAGAAAGAFGEEEKARKQRLAQIAERGYTTILDLIMQGADPAMLDDPGIQKMGQLGLGFHVPAKAMAAVGAAQRAAGVKAAKELELGVPTAEAKAKKAELDLTTLATNEIVQRFGADSTFHKLFLAAWSGTLPYLIEELKVQREDKTLAKQMEMDRTRLLLEGFRGTTTLYKQALDQYERRRTELLVGGNLDPDEIANQQEYARKFGPPPTFEEVFNATTGKLMGVTLDQFNAVTQHGLRVGGIDPATIKVPKGAPPPVGITGDAEFQNALARAQAAVTEEEAKAFAEDLYQAFRERHVHGVEEVRLLFDALRVSVPGDQYNKLVNAYNRTVADIASEGIPSPVRRRYSPRAAAPADTTP